VKNFLIITISILIISFTVIFAINSKTKQNNTQNETPIKTPLVDIYTYYGFRLPIKLESKTVADSLANSSRINISGTNFCEQTISMAEYDHWQIVGGQNFDDGGSFVTDYFINKNNPAIELYCHWNKDSDTFDNGTITFIATNKIGPWLLKIKKNSSAILNEDLNIEDLLDCPGKIVETRPGVTQCN
jgi:hypothetical protein